MATPLWGAFACATALHIKTLGIPGLPATLILNFRTIIESHIKEPASHDEFPSRIRIRRDPHRRACHLGSC
jgi:hypothetical protein